MYKLIFIGLTVSAIAGYFLYSQHKIDTLTKQNAEINLSLSSYVEANNRLRTSINRQQAALEEARASSIEAEQRAVEALQAFEDSDINYLSIQKPELIETIINRGTRNVFYQIENITNQ
jgi:predicted  nucleic acid-binding Zn-ribbon protein